MKKVSSTSHDDFVSQLSTRVSASRKYRHLGIPSATLNDLVEKAVNTHTYPWMLEKAVRHKLHNLVAPYVGDTYY